MTKLNPSPPINPSQRKHLEQFTGKFLFTVRAIKNTMMHSLNNLATQTHSGTPKTVQANTHFLDYISTNPNATKLYHASDIILNIHSDAAYLVVSEARSQAGGFFFLGNIDGSLINNSIHVIAKILKNVLVSAPEEDIGTLFKCTKKAVPTHVTLIGIGHPQPHTPMCTNNSTANSIMNATITQNHSKAIDMRFYWLCDFIKQGQFHIYWAPGSVNLADYFTKNHSPSHHLCLRHIYLHEPTSPTDMQVYVKLLSLPQSSARKVIKPNPKVLQVSSQHTHSACLARAGTRQPVLVRSGTRHAC